MSNNTKIRAKSVIKIVTDSGMHMDFTFAAGTSLKTVIKTLPDVEYDPTEYLVSVIEYAEQTDDPKAFMRCWIEGDWQSIREEWSDFKLLDDQT